MSIAEQAVAELAGILAHADNVRRRAEALRDTEAEAVYRAQVVEMLTHAQIVLAELARAGQSPLVSDVTQIDGSGPLDLTGYVVAANKDYLRSHHFARGWLSAQPDLLERTRPIGAVFETRLEADSALIAVPFDLEGRADLSPGDLHAISAAALGYRSGHGWHLRVTEPELERVVTGGGS